MLRLLVKLLKVLNSESNPGQISLALCLSMVAGLTPLYSLHNLGILMVLLILRANLSAFILGLTLFKGLSYGLDPLFHHLGLWFLTFDPLQGLWTIFYNSPLGQIEKFYNSIVMGSLAFTLTLFFPLYFLANTLIIRYRESLLAYVRRLRIMEIIKGSRIYRLYTSLADPGAAK